MRLCSLAAAALDVVQILAAIVVVGSCREAPPENPDLPAAHPSFVMSTPFSVRSLNDVAIVRSDHRGISSAYAVGTDGTILHFTGTSWAREDSGGSINLESVSGLVDEDGLEQVFCVGASGTVLRRLADGTWMSLASGVSEDLFGVWVHRGDDVFAVGDRGRVLHYDGTALVALTDEVLIDTGSRDRDGNAVEFPIPEPLKSVMGRGDEVFVVGPRGTVYRFDGTRFRREDAATNRPLTDVFTRAGVWAATTDGVLLRRLDDGWRDDVFVAPIPAFLQGIWARNDGDVFAVGLSSELFHLEDGAWSITSLDDGASIRAIDGVELPEPPPDAQDGPSPDSGDDGDEDAQARRQVLAVGAGGRVIRGPQVRQAVGEVALPTFAAEDYIP